jgi:hypothetical protein
MSESERPILRTDSNTDVTLQSSIELHHGKPSELHGPASCPSNNANELGTLGFIDGDVAQSSNVHLNTAPDSSSKWPPIEVTEMLRKLNDTMGV